MTKIKKEDVIEMTPEQVAQDVMSPELPIKEKKVKKDDEKVITLTPKEKLKELSTQRMGKFKVSLSVADAKYIRNLLDRSEWKGPQQAYLLVISKLEMSQICQELKELDPNLSHSVDLSSAAIESISFFMNGSTGKGENSAQRLFAASMLLRPAIGEINKIDTQIEKFNSKEKI